MRWLMAKLRGLRPWIGSVRARLAAVGRPWRRGAALAALALLGVLIASVALNCRSDGIQPPADGGGQIAALRGVPPIRVLLTAAPVEQAVVGTTGGYWLKADGAVAAQSSEPLRAVVRREGTVWRIGPWASAARELIIQPVQGAHVRLGDAAYRGHLRLLPADGGRLIAVNHVELEEYLPGVLAKELYPNWHLETYKALAVAARTFALYQATAAPSGSDYDLGDNQSSQVYGGLQGETARSRQAVRDTRGVVLSHGRPGQERIFLAQYSACCGGQVNGAYVLRNAARIPPLEGGQPCTDCAACTRYRWPAVRISKADIYRALADRYVAIRELGGLRAVEVATVAPYGRAVGVDAVGPAGRRVRLRAEDLRLALLFSGTPAAKALNSMNCDVVDAGAAIEFRNGRGFGHGVGLCQWGAQGKAAKGWTCEQILDFYYPGSRLYRVQ